LLAATAIAAGIWLPRNRRRAANKQCSVCVSDEIEEVYLSGIIFKKIVKKTKQKQTVLFLAQFPLS